MVVIREAVPGDEHAMACVVVDTYRIAHRGQVPDSLLDATPIEDARADSARNWVRTITGPAPGEQAFVAVDDAAGIVGVGMGGPARPSDEVLLGGFDGEVYILYVTIAHQRRGVGLALVRTAFTHMRDQGMSSAVIGVLGANAPARRFYEAIGGRVVGTRAFEEELELPGVVYGWSGAAFELVLAGGPARES